MDYALRRRRRRNRLAGALAFFSTMSAGACANDVAQRAHHRHVSKETADYRHAGSRAAVQVEAQALLVSDGYSIASSSSGTLITAWHEVHDSQRDRLSVTLRYTITGVAVRIEKETQHRMEPDWIPHVSTRDVELETAVLERLEPGARDSRTHVYRVDAERIWDAVADELGRRGHWVGGTAPPLDVTVPTSWVTDASDPPRRSRYEVMIETDGPRKHLHITRVVERSAGPGRWKTQLRQRVPQLELALIKRRDPLRAAEIEAEADEAAQRAFQAARDAGLLSCG